MKSENKGIIFLLLTMLVLVAAIDEAEEIRLRCEGRLGTIPHPNPEMCHLFIQCVVSNQFKFKLQQITIF